MPAYVMLTTLTSQGRKTIKEKPERVKEVNKEVEKMGAKILTQYALLGLYDFITILDVPDEKTISKLAVELGSRGTVKTMTLAAIPVDEFIQSIKK